MQPGERALIARAQRGDAQATEALMMMYRPLLLSLAHRLICPAGWADELLQAGYLGLMQAVRRFDSAKDVQLITYATPWILGEMKRALRRLSAAGAVSLDKELSDDGATLMDVLSIGEEVDIEKIDLRLALQSLSVEEQKVICLRFFRDQTQQETACLLGKSQAQISRIERRALDRLHDRLA